MERNFFNRCLIGRGRKKNVMNPNVFFLSPPKYSPQNEKKTQCIRYIAPLMVIDIMREGIDIIRSFKEEE